MYEEQRVDEKNGTEVKSRHNKTVDDFLGVTIDLQRRVGKDAAASFDIGETLTLDAARYAGSLFHWAMTFQTGAQSKGSFQGPLVWHSQTWMEIEHLPRA